MRIVANITAEATTRVLARLDESNDLIFSRVIELAEHQDTTDGPVCTRHFQVLIHEEAYGIWVFLMVLFAQVLKV